MLSASLKNPFPSFLPIWKQKSLVQNARMQLSPTIIHPCPCLWALFYMCCVVFLFVCLLDVFSFVCLCVVGLLFWVFVVVV